MRSSTTCFGVLRSRSPKAMLSATRQVRVERVALEHHRDVAVLRRHVVDDAAADRDRAVGDRLEARDHPQRGRLAAARRADEDEELAVLDVEREVLHGVEAVGIDLVDLLQHDLSHRASPRSSQVSRRGMRARRRAGRRRSPRSARRRRRAARARRAEPGERQTDVVRRRARREAEKPLVARLAQVGDRVRADVREADAPARERAEERRRPISVR